MVSGTGGSAAPGTGGSAGGDNGTGGGPVTPVGTGGGSGGSVTPPGDRGVSGGCACDTAASGGASTFLGLALLAFAGVAVRRPRRQKSRTR
jgi:MYXO-CTERM domain-containing protein